MQFQLPLKMWSISWLSDGVLIRHLTTCTFHGHEQNGGSPVEMDWRAFRAQLVQTEKPGNKSIGPEGSMMPAAKRWAHPILAPEAGCVLIATEKLDGQQNFERTVILLLSPGSSNPREGPYGLILNRPLLRRIKDIKPKDRALVKHFGNCQV
jgi:hypothetical protein